jgi:hypothetical protein
MRDVLPLSIISPLCSGFRIFCDPRRQALQWSRLIIKIA